MVKVLRGNLPRQRIEGYHQYRGGFEKGEGFGVRRIIPTSKIQTEGDTHAQKQEKESFKIATKLYAGFDPVQKDFYKRAGKVSIKHDKQGREIRKYLTRRTFAINDIIAKLNSPSSPYPEPLPFCICCVDTVGNALPGYTLTITSEKLKSYGYEEESDETACYPPSAVSPLYEPYKLMCGEAIYPALTAEDIHKMRTICPYELTGCEARYNEVLTSADTTEVFCNVNFKEVGIPKGVAAVADICVKLHLEGLHTNYWVYIYTTDWSCQCHIDWAIPTLEYRYTKTVHDGDVVHRSWYGRGDWGEGNLYVDECSVKIRQA